MIFSTQNALDISREQHQDYVKAAEQHRLAASMRDEMKPASFGWVRNFAHTLRHWKHTTPPMPQLQTATQEMMAVR